MSGNSGWDVAFPSNSFIQPMRDLGLLEHLEHKRLGNLSNLEPRFQSPEWDPASQLLCTLHAQRHRHCLFENKLTPASRLG